MLEIFFAIEIRAGFNLIHVSQGLYRNFQKAMASWKLQHILVPKYSCMTIVCPSKLHARKSKLLSVNMLHAKVTLIFTLRYRNKNFLHSSNFHYCIVNWKAVNLRWQQWDFFEILMNIHKATFCGHDSVQEHFT